MPYTMPGKPEDVNKVKQDQKTKKIENVDKAKNKRTAADAEKTEDKKLADSSDVPLGAASVNSGLAVTAVKERDEDSAEQTDAILQKDLPVAKSSKPETAAKAADAGQSADVDDGPHPGDDWDAAMAAEEQGNQWLYSCIMCGDGGDVVMCEACPRVYHIDCLGQSARVGRGGWCVTVKA